MRKDRFTDEALRNARALAELKYSESPEEQLAFAEAYDFARCQRPDGSFYGTSGQCRKGTEAGAAPAREGTGARGGRMAAEQARAEGKKGKAIRAARAEGAKAAVAAARAEGGRKITANNERTRAMRAQIEKDREAMRAEMKNAKTDAERGRIIEKYQRRMSAAAERVAAEKAGRTASQLTPKEQAARAERQKANEANRQAQAGAADAQRRRLKTDFRREVAAGAAKRAAADAKREERRQRDNELRGMIRDKMADQRGRKGELDRLERAYKDQARKVKAEPTKEGKARLKEVARQLREQERFFNRGERELEKMGRERIRIAQQNERERMTPAQRAEAARVRKIIKERG